MSTDTAHLPPLPPIAVTPDAAPVVTTAAAILPPHDTSDLLVTAASQPSDCAEVPVAAKKAPLLSQRANDLLTAVTVLLAGISTILWADLLDPTDGQWFVTTAATGSAFTSVVLFITLRSFRRPEPQPIRLRVREHGLNAGPV